MPYKQENFTRMKLSQDTRNMRYFIKVCTQPQFKTCKN